MAEYIDKKEVIKVLTQIGVTVAASKMRTVAKCISAVESMEAADAEPVRHGRWIGLEYDGYADDAPVYDLWECSECGEEVRGDDVPDTHPWCHSCGAKMDADG